MKFDHIGIVVASMKAGRTHMGSLFGISRWTEEFADPVNKVWVQFGLDGSGICYEIIAPYGEGSPVERALQAGDRILNHVAYLISDLDTADSEMRARRCFPVAPPNPAIAYNGARIQFFISPLRFIFELIEAPEHQHSYLAPV